MRIAIHRVPNTVITSVAVLAPAALLALHAYVPLWSKVSAATLRAAVGGPLAVVEVEAAEVGTLQASEGFG